MAGKKREPGKGSWPPKTAFIPEFKLTAGGGAGVAASARCIPLDSEPGPERLPPLPEKKRVMPVI